MRTFRSVRDMPVLATAVALAAGTLVALAPTPAQAAAGAALPFTSVEAESASGTGTRIGPEYTQGTLASEASGRQVCASPRAARRIHGAPRPTPWVDGDPNTYWESANHAFPQSLTVDLGAREAVRRLVLKLPPQAAWQARTQTLSVQGSTDGSAWSTVVPATDHRFDPASGNTVTVPLPAGTNLRHLRPHVTANTGWSAAQFSEVEAYLS